MKIRLFGLVALSACLLTACGPGGSFNLPPAGENEPDGGLIIPIELPDSVTKNQLVSKYVISQIKSDRIYNEITQDTFNSFFSQETAPLSQVGVTFAGVPSQLFVLDGIQDPNQSIPVNTQNFLYSPGATQIPVIYRTNLKQGTTALQMINIAADLAKGSKYEVVPGQPEWNLYSTTSSDQPRADYVLYLDNDRMFLKVYTTSDGQKIRLGSLYVSHVGSPASETARSSVTTPALMENGAASARPISSLFLVGGIRSSNLPTQGLVHYKGVIMMTAQTAANSGKSEGWGIIGHDADKATINLDADFSNRKLTGSFDVSYDEGDFVAQYNINAIIIANAAVGMAEGKYKTENDKIRHGSPDLSKVTDKTYALFNAAFYGEKADVVAGYIKATKGEWGAVFGAKSTSQENTQYAGDLYQAGVFEVSVTKDASGKVKTTTGKYDPFKPINFSGNLKALEVGGLVIHVKSTKAKQGDYKSTNLSFGQWPVFNEKTDTEGLSDADKALAKKMNEEAQALSKQNLGGFYLQGFLTPTAVVAKKTGKVYYKGQWDFNASDAKGTYASYGANARVELVADFDNKTVQGNFYDQEDLKVIDFTNGKIEGNGWTAQNVLIQGLSSSKRGEDHGGFTNQFSTNDLFIKAWFYGPLAEETGGYIYSESTKAAGVFGAAHYTPNTTNSK